MAYYYLKLHHEMLYDPKMGMLSDHLYRRVIEIFLMASEQAERDGYLPELNIMAWKLHVNKDDLEAELMELARTTGIVHQEQGGSWYVTNFVKRQASKDPTAPERMQRYRERIDNGTDTQDVTRNVTRNEIEKLRVELRVKNLEENKNLEEKETKAPPATTITDPSTLQWYFQMVTDMVTFPATSRSNDLERLYAIYAKERGNIVEYLRPYWQEWLSRGYSKVNTAWLDWAVAGQIPKRKIQSNNGGKPKEKLEFYTCPTHGIQVLKDHECPQCVEAEDETT